MNQEKVFADGIRFKNPGPKAPTFVKGKISVNVDNFIKFLQIYSQNGWVNLDLKESKNGVLYLELNTYQKYKKPKVDDGQDDKGYDQSLIQENKIEIEELPF